MYIDILGAQAFILKYNVFQTVRFESADASTRWLDWWLFGRGKALYLYIKL
jgi:hypothetical protein